MESERVLQFGISGTTVLSDPLKRYCPKYSKIWRTFSWLRISRVEESIGKQTEDPAQRFSNFTRIRQRPGARVSRSIKKRSTKTRRNQVRDRKDRKSYEKKMGIQWKITKTFWWSWGMNNVWHVPHGNRYERVKRHRQSRGTPRWILVTRWITPSQARRGRYLNSKEAFRESFSWRTCQSNKSPGSIKIQLSVSGRRNRLESSGSIFGLFFDIWN